MNYDVIVVGGGVSGITASIYAASRNLSVLLVEQGDLGGTIFRASKVSHFPGLVTEETGASYTKRMVTQAKEEGVHFLHGKVEKLVLEGNKKIATIDGKAYQAKAIILATGGYPKPLGVPQEQTYLGKGLSYNAPKDAPAFKDKTVIVVGGSDAALKECHYIASLAKKVHLIHALPKLEAIPVFQEKAKAMKNIEIHLETTLAHISGKDFIQTAELKNQQTGKSFEVSDEEGIGVFIFIGNAPHNELFSDILPLEGGYITGVKPSQETTISGVFACGDICKKTVRQLATAASDGAIAGIAVKAYIDSL